jgi:predicted dehydrogenase
MIHRAVIIGAGRIACGYDAPQSRHVLTHAHALVKHPRFLLSGITDIDSIRGKKEARKWKTEFFHDTDTMLLKVEPDVVIIATPPDTHANLLQKIAAKKPKLIICEKPVISSKAEGEVLRQYFSQNSIPVIINFSRRFDPTIYRERDMLMKGKYGRVISANAIYSNGFLNNGSHVMDLARFLFGEMTEAKAFAGIPDHGEEDRSIAGFATFERCPQFSFMTGDERLYSVFEFNVFTERKRLQFVNFGVELRVQDVVSDPVFKGFRGLAKPKTLKTEFSKALPNLFDHVVSVLEGKTAPLSSLEDGIKTQEACFKLLASFKK